MNHGHMRNYGLVEVHRKASNHPDCFIGKKAWEFHDMMDILVGQIAFCLPSGDDDVDWKAVIVTMCFDIQQHDARLTWVHPGCIRFLTNDELDRCSVVIGLTEGRGRQSWTHDIGPRQPGIRHVSSQLVLDTRWRKTFAGRESCTGHCLDMFQAIVQVPQYFWRPMHLKLQNLAMGGDHNFCCG